jgi:hypothetical protein
VKLVSTSPSDHSHKRDVSGTLGPVSQLLRRCDQEDHGPGHLDKNHDTVTQKITKAKKAEDLARVVEGLPSKCEVLSSNPSTIQTNKNNSDSIRSNPNFPVCGTQ